MWNVATAFLVTLAIHKFKNNAPPPPTPPEPKPEPPQDPMTVTTVFTEDEKIIDISTESVGPFQKHGDWFLRHLFKNKIGILNKSQKIFKILYKPHPLLNGFSIKECTADFNVDYDWESEKIFPGEYKKLDLDTYRCDIKILQENKLVFKHLCCSSKNIIIQEKVITPRLRSCLPFF